MAQALADTNTTAERAEALSETGLHQPSASQPSNANRFGIAPLPPATLVPAPVGMRRRSVSLRASEAPAALHTADSGRAQTSSAIRTSRALQVDTSGLEDDGDTATEQEDVDQDRDSHHTSPRAMDGAGCDRSEAAATDALSLAQHRIAGKSLPRSRGGQRAVPRQATPTTRRRLELLNGISRRGLPGERVLRASGLTGPAGSGREQRTALQAQLPTRQEKRMSAAMAAGQAAAAVKACHTAAMNKPLAQPHGESGSGIPTTEAVSEAADAGFAVPAVSSQRSLKAVTSLRGQTLFKQAEGEIESTASQAERVLRLFVQRSLRRFRPMTLAHRLTYWAGQTGTSLSEGALRATQEREAQDVRRRHRQRLRHRSSKAVVRSLGGNDVSHAAAAGVVAILASAQEHRPKVVHGVALMQAAANAAIRSLGFSETETDALIARTGAPSAEVRARGKQEIRQASFQLLSGKRPWGQKLRAAATAATIFSRSRKSVPPPPTKRPGAQPPERNPTAPAQLAGSSGAAGGQGPPPRGTRRLVLGGDDQDGGDGHSSEEDGSLRSFRDGDETLDQADRLTVRFAEDQLDQAGDCTVVPAAKAAREAVPKREAAAEAARAARRNRLTAKGAIMMHEASRNAEEEAIMKALLLEAGEKLLGEGPGGRRADSAVAWVQWRKQLVDEKPEARTALSERVKRYQQEEGSYLEGLRAEYVAAKGRPWQRPPELPLKRPLNVLLPAVRAETLRERAQQRDVRMEEAKVKAMEATAQRRSHAEARSRRLSLRRKEEQSREQWIWWAVLVKLGASARVMGEQATFARLRSINQTAALFLQRVWRGRQAREWISRFRKLRPILSRQVWRWRLGRRIAVRNRAADRIKTFVGEFCVTVRSERVRLYIRRFMDRVRVVQARVRQHQASNAARCVMLATWWRVIEQRLHYALRRHRERSQQERLYLRQRLESVEEAAQLQQLLQRTITRSGHKSSPQAMPMELATRADQSSPVGSYWGSDCASDAASEEPTPGSHIAASASRVGFDVPRAGQSAHVVNRPPPFSQNRAQRARQGVIRQPMAPAVAGAAAEHSQTQGHQQTQQSVVHAEVEEQQRHRPSVMRRRGRLPPTLHVDDASKAMPPAPCRKGGEARQFGTPAARTAGLSPSVQDSMNLPAITGLRGLRPRHAVVSDVLQVPPGGVPFTPALTARRGGRASAFRTTGPTEGTGSAWDDEAMVSTPVRPGVPSTPFRLAAAGRKEMPSGPVSGAERSRSPRQGMPTKVGRWDLRDRRVLQALEAPIDAATRITVVKTYLLSRLRQHATEVGLQRLQAVRSRLGDEALTLLTKEQAMKIQAKRLAVAGGRGAGDASDRAVSRQHFSALTRPGSRGAAGSPSTGSPRQQPDGNTTPGAPAALLETGGKRDGADAGFATASPGESPSATIAAGEQTPVALLRATSGKIAKRPRRHLRQAEEQSAFAVSPRSSPGEGMESDTAASTADQLRIGAMHIASRQSRRRRSSLFGIAGIADGRAAPTPGAARALLSPRERDSPTPQVPVEQTPSATPAANSGLFKVRAPRLETSRDVRLALHLVPPDSELGRQAAETAKAFQPAPLRLLGAEHHMDVVGMMVEAYRISSQHA